MKKYKTIRISEETYKRLLAHNIDDAFVHGTKSSLDDTISEMIDFIEENGDQEAITRIKKRTEQV